MIKKEKTVMLQQVMTNPGETIRIINNIQNTEVRILIMMKL